MPADLVGDALLIWAALMLLLPKRGLRGLPHRFADVFGGRRRRVFGPSPHGRFGAAPQTALIRRIPGVAVSVVQIGLPLHAVELIARRHGGLLRMGRPLHWGESATGLAWRVCEGEITEAGLNARLLDLGVPPLRPRVSLERDADFIRPPVSWTDQWESEHAGLPEPSGSTVTLPGRLDVGPPRHPSARLRILTLGRLRILDGDEDLAPNLLRRPVLAFLWLLLLVRATVEPTAGTDRATVGQELAPWLEREQQLTKLRGRLRDTFEHLDPRLSRLVIADDYSIHFDIASCSYDVDLLRTTASEVGAAPTLMTRGLMDEAGELVESSAGEFLPEWDALEDRVSMGKGSMAQTVEQVRYEVERHRVDILAALGSAYAAWKMPGPALRFLEEAHSRRPDMEPVARSFADLLRAVGQPSRARQVEAEHGFGA